MMGDFVAALPYHVPGIGSVLIQSCFLILLNITNFLLDKLTFCGLVGQVLLGMVWGTPGGDLLGTSTEEVIVKLGYLGLILLVYEGGLSTSFASLKADILLSTVIAVTGIVVPIGLSFYLYPLVSATSLQSFAAGTALCSTSLGTTLTILSTSGLSKTRLGTVITGAAILDDIAGLVLVQVVSNLGRSNNVPIGIVLRPAFVSLAFVVIVLLGCKFVVTPLTYRAKRRRCLISKFAKRLPADALAFCIHNVFLFGPVAGASYAGTSDLFAAWVVGAVISWWDDEFFSDTWRDSLHLDERSNRDLEPDNHEVALWESSSDDTNDEYPAANFSIAETQWSHEIRGTISPPESHLGSEEYTPLTGAAVYERYYHSVVEKILKPLFFASIGFAIPVTEMFHGDIVWRGIIYSLLMAFSKLVTGLWLVSFRADILGFATVLIRLPSNRLWYLEFQDGSFMTSHRDPPLLPATAPSVGARHQTNYSTTHPDSSAQSNQQDDHSDSASCNTLKSQSLYPASITGLAMIARGEIGFLISSLAESEGISSDSEATKANASPLYLIVTWAIVVNTIIGPLAVGALVRRVNKIQRRQKTLGGPDPLGPWGALRLP